MDQPSQNSWRGRSEEGLEVEGTPLHPLPAEMPVCSSLQPLLRSQPQAGCAGAAAALAPGLPAGRAKSQCQPSPGQLGCSTVCPKGMCFHFQLTPGPSGWHSEGYHAPGPGTTTSPCKCFVLIYGSLNQQLFKVLFTPSFSYKRKGRC